MKSSHRIILAVVVALLPVTILLGTTAAKNGDSDTAQPAPDAATVSTSPTPRTTATPLTNFESDVRRNLDTTVNVNPKITDSLSAVVIDAASGTPVWNHNGSVARMPASTQKTITAFTVLSSISPTHQLATVVYQDPTRPENLYLKGEADPTLSKDRLKQLAEATAVKLKEQQRSVVTLFPDPSFLPDSKDLAAGWEPKYMNSEVQVPRGLTMINYRGWDAPKKTAEEFAALLKPLGITATVQPIAATPGNPTELARTLSDPLSRLLAYMLSMSNNDYAEFLLRRAAVARGYPGDWAGALANERDLLTAAGIPLEGWESHDGSGLSRANHVPPAMMAEVIRQMWNDPAMRAVAFAPMAMPSAGNTGTLRRRFHDAMTVCARGQVMAKTGNLRDVISLAGVAMGSDGKPRAFAFLENGMTDKFSVRVAFDTMATSVVGCRLTPEPGKGVTSPAQRRTRPGR